MAKKCNLLLVWLAKKIYVGVKILSNTKAEILLKNAQKRKAKNFKLRCGAKIEIKKNWPKNVIFAGLVGQKIYVGVKILSNAKAEILSKNSQKRKAKNFKLRCGPKNWRKKSKKRYVQNTQFCLVKMGGKHI